MAICQRERKVRSSSVVGSCGLLVLAECEGWITNVVPLLDQLQRDGYFITPAVRASIQQQSGEM